MEQDFFTNLPTEIMIDILSILPTRSIASCKCVCKSWRNLIKSCEFVESHFSRSVPCLALYNIVSKFDIIEFVDTQSSGKNCYCNKILNFSFPHEARIYGSANGLLFLLNDNADDIFICNPITHEYIKLPPTVKRSFNDVVGFGASKLSGEYKVVRLFYEGNHRTSPLKCEVYSLRRGSLRSVETGGDQLRHAQLMSGAVFLNGNLHWLVGVHSELHQFREILCFDLETECFSTFSNPPDHHLPNRRNKRICALGGCLCLYHSSRDDGLVIWLMKKYGDAQSWTKEFFIKSNRYYLWYYISIDYVVPINVSKDGVVLFAMNSVTSRLYYYSSKTETIQGIDGSAEWCVENGTRPRIYTPNFVPLKTLTMENNVISF